MRGTPPIYLTQCNASASDQTLSAPQCWSLRFSQGEVGELLLLCCSTEAAESDIFLSSTELFSSPIGGSLSSCSFTYSSRSAGSSKLLLSLMPLLYTSELMSWCEASRPGAICARSALLPRR